MEETEVMIREDFASAIEDKKPLDEINTLHNNIRSNLDTAEKLFQQQQHNNKNICYSHYILSISR